MKPIWLVAPLLVAALCSTGAQSQTPRNFVPVTDATIENPDPADWLMWRRTLDAWGYSPLDGIDSTNVARLQLVWARGLGPGAAQEGTPLVYNRIMYMPNPDDLIQAIDAVTGDLLWEYKREWPDDIRDFIRFPGINRNIAIYDDLIIDTSGDDYLFALDALSGELVWETEVLDYRVNTAQQSSGPIIADGKVISGRNCYSEGGPEACVVTAHDALTGEEVWRTSTIPRPGEPGDESWGDVPYENRWHVGTWMVPSYDPELGLIYFGTSVTSPAAKFLMGSNDDQYLYHNSTLALDVETGGIVWYYQHIVDHWDLDHPFERLLIDTVVAPDPNAVRWINPGIESGEIRRVLTGIPGKTGVVYTLDRETGEFLWARPTVAQTVVDDIDGQTGMVTVNPEMVFTEPGQERLVCPTTNGGKLWPAGAYSPLNNIMYFPLQNTCMNTTSLSVEPVMSFIDEGGRQSSRYGIRNQTMIAAGTGNVGTVIAISVETGETFWQNDQRAGVTSLLTTGGGLLFSGDANGRFRALDQNTGAILWEVNLGAAVTGYPIAYAIDGRQYVAVSTGSSPLTNGLNRLTPELRPGVANNLFVFALPEENR